MRRMDLNWRDESENSFFSITEDISSVGSLSSQSVENHSNYIELEWDRDDFVRCAFVSGDYSNCGTSETIEDPPRQLSTTEDLQINPPLIPYNSFEVQSLLTLEGSEVVRVLSLV